MLEQTILKLESDNKELKERVLRALAEVENMRMRCTAALGKFERRGV